MDIENDGSVSEKFSIQSGLSRLVGLPARTPERPGTNDI